MQLEFPKPKSAVCEHCGAKMVEYPYRFDASTKQFLLKLESAGGKAHMDELNLTHTQYVQSSRLRYWKLARMVDEGGREAVKGGLWELTSLGHDFARGIT